HAAELKANPTQYDADFRAFVKGYGANDPNQKILGSRLPIWLSLGIAGLDMRPALTCLIGIILAIALNKCTSYYTHTQYTPVKSLAKACTTGHATNIIQGFAVGYESTVVSVLIIAVALFLSVVIYHGASPIFVA